MLLLLLSKYPLTKQVFIQVQIKRYGSLGNAIVTFLSQQNIIVWDIP
jgi:hypothetical protein